MAAGSEIDATTGSRRIVALDGDALLGCAEAARK